jgi:murein DD-endopeptidase MepM/ murein hydrolase activator NlpD
LDYDLMNQADRLISRLSYYEATCREGGIQVGSDGLGSALRAYATRALPVDQRVRTVGEGFQRADGQADTFLGKLARLRLGSALFRLIRPGRVLAAEDGPDLGGRTPTPVPKPVPTPTPPVKLYDGINDKPSWLGEKIKALKDWITGLWDGRSSPAPPPVTPTPFIVNSQRLPEKKSPPAATGSEPDSPPAAKTAIPLAKLFEGGATKLSQGAHPNLESPPRGVAVDIIPADRSKVPFVHALVGGKVVKKGFEDGGYGHYIKILQDDGTVVLYAHLAAPAGQNVGDYVNAGDQLAKMGNTGYVKGDPGTHLHIEFREPKYDKQGKYVTDSAGIPDKWNNGTFDPIEYLKQHGIVF